MNKHDIHRPGRTPTMTTSTPRIIAEVAAPSVDIIDPTDPPEAWLPEPWTWWRVEWVKTQTIHPDATVPDGWRIVGTRQVTTTQRTHFDAAEMGRRMRAAQKAWQTDAPDAAELMADLPTPHRAAVLRDLGYRNQFGQVRDDPVIQALLRPTLTGGRQWENDQTHRADPATGGATLITLTPELWPTIAPEKAIYGGDDIRDGRGMVGLGVHTSADYWACADLWVARAPAGTPLPDGWTHVPRPDGEPTKTGSWLPWIAPSDLDEYRAGTIWVDWMHLPSELVVATAWQQLTGRWSPGRGTGGHHTTMPGTHATAEEALDVAEAAIAADREAINERWSARNWCHADLDAPIVRRVLGTST